MFLGLGFGLQSSCIPGASLPGWLGFLSFLHKSEYFLFSTSLFRHDRWSRCMVGGLDSFVFGFVKRSPLFPAYIGI